MKSKATQEERVYTLDYIRAISCILVILYHYTCRYGEIFDIANSKFSFSWGYLAVNTFFLLSGALTISRLKPNDSCFRFLIKRALRIYPAYWVAILLTTAFMSLLLPQNVKSLSDILLNLTAFQQYVGAESVDGAYWTLPIELIFYFWIAACLFATKCFGSKAPPLRNAIYFLWAISSCSITVISKLFGFPFLEYLKVLIISDRAPIFILGGAVALFCKKGAAHSKKDYAAILLCFVIAMANCFLAFGWKVALWAVVWSAILLAALKLNHFMLWKPLHKVLVFLAQISFPLYLIHQFIGYGIIQNLSKINCVLEISILVASLISVVLATAIHYCVERPSENLARKILRR